MINEQTYLSSDVAEEIIFQFKSLEKEVAVLVAALKHEKAAHNALKDRFEAVHQQKLEQTEQLQAAQTRTKELENKVKQLDKNEVVLKEKLKNFKHFNNIVKIPKNAEETAKLKIQLDAYIQHVDDALGLLRAL